MQFLHTPGRTAAIFCFATLTFGTAWAGSQDENLPNFQKVDDHVYRGGQPTDDGFKELAKRGIKTVIDLRKIGEHSQENEQKVVTGLGMRYVSIPMHGLSTPKDNLVAAVQTIFNDTSSGPVFVHCKRGADRTGMVVAVYRISHDKWDNKKALHEAKSYGMSFLERAIQHYVLAYKPGTVVATAGTEAPTASASVSPVGEALAVR
jgi:protein tyrosine phosphatase (PTP) superfamily phosphohydrolase (DUF442 family)